MLRRVLIGSSGGVAALVLIAAVHSILAQDPAQPAQPSEPSGSSAHPGKSPVQASPTDPDITCGKYKLVERTVCVPEICMERRMVKTIECRPETRECQLTITRQIPHTTYCEKECCETRAEPRTRIECYTVCRPIVDFREETICSVEAVHTETPCTRCVSKAVPVKEKRFKWEDEGQWIEQPCEVCKPACKPGCKPDCNPPCAPATKKVWIPKPVEKEYFVTTWKQEWTNEVYNKVCTCLKPVTRVVQVPYVKCCVKECKTREVSYTVCVPVTVTRKIPITTYTCETVPVTKTYTVMVPHCVEKEIQVPVCRMVTKTITCKVPVCN